jgi:hypothetical protein
VCLGSTVPTKLNVSVLFTLGDRVIHDNVVTEAHLFVDWQGTRVFLRLVALP